MVWYWRRNGDPLSHSCAAEPVALEDPALMSGVPQCPGTPRDTQCHPEMPPALVGAGR